MDDALAIELGADIHGAVPDVFTNADGIKRSISAPGVGNYVSFAKAVASAVSIVGESAVCGHSFIHAHGSSTPANRVTESRIFDRVAKAFAIKDWPITAAKAFVGHSLAAASGDQLVFALGTFKYNILPGIKTVDKIAEDVFQDRLLFPLEDLDLTDRKMKVAFINSKGFGGNNATAIVISPSEVEKMVKARHSKAYEEYIYLREETRQEAKKYAENANKGDVKIVYRFGEELVKEEDIEITADHIKIPGFSKDVVFDKNNPWKDMS
jgi:acetoacetyl-[acyl-carrier protein] synthase